VADAGVCAVVLLVRGSFGLPSFERPSGVVGRYEQVDEHFARTGLGHIEINDFSRDLAGLVIDASFIGSG
jgi:hypothetical protein